MKSKQKMLMIGASLFLGASLTFSGCGPTAVSDGQISLRTGNMVNIGPVLDAPQYSTLDAGDSKKKQRSFYGAPPLVPHSIADLEQTAEANECMDCHLEGDEDTPAIPATHKIKAVVKSVSRSQSKDGMLHQVKGHAKVSEGINHERYFCTTCHVPQADNLKPLVENTFSRSMPKNEQQDVLDNLNDFKY